MSQPQDNDHWPEQIPRPGSNSSHPTSPDPKLIYRHKKTGTVYDDVQFNGTPYADVFHAGGWYTVDEKNIEIVPEPQPFTSPDSSIELDKILDTLSDYLPDDCFGLNHNDLPETKQAIEALIALAVQEARIDELEHINVSEWASSSYEDEGFTSHDENFKRRINTLTNNKKGSSE